MPWKEVLHLHIPPITQKELELARNEAKEKGEEGPATCYFDGDARWVCTRPKGHVDLDEDYNRERTDGHIADRADRVVAVWVPGDEEEPELE